MACVGKSFYFCVNLLFITNSTDFLSHILFWSIDKCQSIQSYSNYVTYKTEQIHSFSNRSKLFSLSSFKIVDNDWKVRRAHISQFSKILLTQFAALFPPNWKHKTKCSCANCDHLFKNGDIELYRMKLTIYTILLSATVCTWPLWSR